MKGSNFKTKGYMKFREQLIYTIKQKMCVKTIWPTTYLKRTIMCMGYKVKENILLLCLLRLKVFSSFCQESAISFSIMPT